MHSTTLALPLFAAAAAAASAASFNPAWNVTRSYRIVSQQVTSYNLTAVFVSEAYPDGLESHCSWLEHAAFATPDVPCEPSTFSINQLRNGSKLFPWW